MEIVHLHPNRLNRSINIFLLLIPALVFAILLTLFSLRYQNVSVATTGQSQVLGGESSK